MNITLDAKKLRDQAEILRQLIPHLDAAADLCDKFIGKKTSSSVVKTAARNGKSTRSKRRAPNGSVKPLMVEVLKEQGKPTKLKELVSLMSKRSGIDFKVDTVSKLLFSDSQFTRPGRGLYSLAGAAPAADARTSKAKSAKKPKATAKR